MLDEDPRAPGEEELRLYKEAVEALLSYVAWNGGCGHHRDDCPNKDSYCRIVNRVEETLSRLRNKKSNQDQSQDAVEIRPNKKLI